MLWIVSALLLSSLREAGAVRAVVDRATFRDSLMQPYLKLFWEIDPRSLHYRRDAQNLLQRLITPDLSKRLGNLHGGSKDVMAHAWFSEVTWERLAKKDIDAPYVPPVKGGAGDASQFDKYPEETEEYGKKGDDP